VSIVVVVETFVEVAAVVEAVANYFDEVVVFEVLDLVEVVDTLVEVVDTLVEVVDILVEVVDILVEVVDILAEVVDILLVVSFVDN
jgi:hypothetical protein